MNGLMMVVIVSFSEVLLFRKGKSFPQPFFQLAGPLALVREVVTEAPAVAAGRIDMQRGGYLLFAQGEEVTDAVDGQYGCVIGGQHDEGLRGLGRYLPFERVFLFQFVRRSLADEVLA